MRTHPHLTHSTLSLLTLCWENCKHQAPRPPAAKLWVTVHLRPETWTLEKISPTGTTTLLDLTRKDPEHQLLYPEDCCERPAVKGTVAEYLCITESSNMDTKFLAVPLCKDNITGLCTYERLCPELWEKQQEEGLTDELWTLFNIAVETCETV